MGTGFAKKKKQAKMMQDQISKMQDNMQNVEITGTAGNGLVTLVLTGEYELKQVKINPECVDREDIEGLEDLIKAAYQDAVKQLTQKMSSSLPKGMPGLPF